MSPVKGGHPSPCSVPSLALGQRFETFRHCALLPMLEKFNPSPEAPQRAAVKMNQRARDITIEAPVFTDSKSGPYKDTHLEMSEQDKEEAPLQK